MIVLLVDCQVRYIYLCAFLRKVDLVWYIYCYVLCV